MISGIVIQQGIFSLGKLIEQKFWENSSLDINVVEKKSDSITIALTIARVLSL